MTTARTKATRLAFFGAAIGVTTLALTSCAGGGEAAAPTDFAYLSFAENTSIQDTLTTLSEDACAAENEALPLKVSTQPQASYDQQLQLLAGQNALPSLFASGNSPQVAKDLQTGDKLVDVAAELDELGAADDILPAARSTIEALYGGEVFVLPTELNVEGIWYNKADLRRATASRSPPPGMNSPTPRRRSTEPA